MELVERVYEGSSSYPRTEDYALVTQMRRAAVSVPSNIAEGTARLTKKEFATFLRYSSGSLRELDTQLEIALRVGFMKRSIYDPLKARVDEVGRMLAALIKSQMGGKV